jgi:hypothetical protein
MIIPVFAMYTRDLQLLQKSLRDYRYHECDKRMRELAIWRCWAPGLMLLIRRWGEFACDKEMYYALCFAASVPDPERNNMEFWIPVLGLGQQWRDAVFSATFFCGDFPLVERALQEGALQGSSRVPGAGWRLCEAMGSDWLYRHALGDDWRYLPQEWLCHVRYMLRSDELRERPPRKRNAFERRIIYVAALVDPDVAWFVVPHIKQWMKAKVCFCWWWGTNTCTRAPTHPGAPDRHLPNVAEMVLEKAGLDLPRVWREAEAVAAVIRKWAGVPGPDKSFLALTGGFGVAAPAAKGPGGDLGGRNGKREGEATRGELRRSKRLKGGS